MRPEPAVWDCAAAPSANKTISTALHSKAALDIASAGTLVPTMPETLCITFDPASEIIALRPSPETMRPVLPNERLIMGLSDLSARQLQRRDHL
jgi:hypothetical protein